MDDRTFIVVRKDDQGCLQVELLAERVLEVRLNSNYYGPATRFYASLVSATNWDDDALYIFQGKIVIPQERIGFTLEKS